MKLYKPLIYRGIIHDKYLINEHGHVIDVDGNELPIYYNNGKYKTISITDDICHSFVMLHKAVAETFIPNPDPDRLNVVNHKDGNKSNCESWNLEWTTHRENLIHALKMGFRVPPKGEKNYRASYTDEEVHKICKMLQDGKSYDEILTEFNIPCTKENKGALKGMRSKRNWKHITTLYDFPKTQNRGKLKNEYIHKICTCLSNGERNIVQILQESNLESNKANKQTVKDIYRCKVYKKIWRFYYWDNTVGDLYEI